LTQSGVVGHRPAAQAGGVMNGLSNDLADVGQVVERSGNGQYISMGRSKMYVQLLVRKVVDAITLVAPRLGLLQNIPGNACRQTTWEGL